MAPTDFVRQLSWKLNDDWPAIHAAIAASASRVQFLNSALSKFTTEDTSLVIFGSLARAEFTSGSDLDWVLLVDGIASPEHLDVCLEIESYLETESFQRPGPEATFGGLIFGHDLIHYIGGNDDTNANLTRRMLLLLESLCIGRGDAYRRVVNNVLRRYIDEDYGWVNARNPMDIPRFLQNDISRYWRTLAVDFAYKRRHRAGRGWALRTAKLRLSRKLTYASGLLMCFLGAIGPAGSRISPAEHPESAPLEMVDHLSMYVNLSPLDIFAKFFLEYPTLDAVASRMFKVYDEFLAILNDDPLRRHLEELRKPDVAQDAVYQRVRGLGHEFQAALDAIFFDPSGCPEVYQLIKTLWGILMRPFGFSTGALAPGDFNRAIRMLDGIDIQAIELSALRFHELASLLEFTRRQDLNRFQYISVHAPTDYTGDQEASVVKSLAHFAEKGWPIVAHPDVIRDYSPWKELGSSLMIENMDKRKPVGRAEEELELIFERLPQAFMCFDIAHARQVDTSMTEAYRMAKTFREKIKQIHISSVNTSSKHDLISPITAQAFHEVAFLLPISIPVILETPVEGLQLNEQLEMAAISLRPRSSR